MRTLWNLVDWRTMILARWDPVHFLFNWFHGILYRSLLARIILCKIARDGASLSYLSNWNQWSTYFRLHCSCACWSRLLLRCTLNSWSCKRYALIFRRYRIGFILNRWLDLIQLDFDWLRMLCALTCTWVWMHSSQTLAGACSWHTLGCTHICLWFLLSLHNSFAVRSIRLM